MRNDDTPITIAGILEMTPGDKDNPVWINQPFTATVDDVTQRKTGAGQPMFTGTLTDEDTGASIAFSAFGRKFFPPQGALVSVSGQGISLGEYKGNLQLTIGQKAVVGTVAGAPARQQQPAQRSAVPAQRQSAAPAAKGPGVYFGATVGMAVNNGVAIALQQAEAGALEAGSEDFFRAVYGHASRLVRMAGAMEGGNLAPQPSTAARSQQQQQQPEDMPADYMPGDPGDPEITAVQQRQQVARHAQPERAPVARPRPGPDGSVDTSDVNNDRIPF